MKRVFAALIASAVVGALFVMGPLGALPKGTENFNKTFENVADCGDQDIALSIFAPEKLWPPNHKYFEDIYVVATDTDGGQISLETDGYHDQYVEGDNGMEEQNGAGNTADDMVSDDEQATINDSTSQEGYPAVATMESAADTVRTDWDARAERSGRDQTGRTYYLHGLATDDDGESCELSVTFEVPHDMRPSNRGTDQDA